MSNPYVLLGLFVLGLSVSATAFYAIKRYFDDKAAARTSDYELSSQLVVQLAELTNQLSEHGVLLRERLEVFEKALGQAILQFAEIVKSTKHSELETKAQTAGAAMKFGRRMPKP